MKSFAEYITEANPVVDKQSRSMAMRLYNRMIAAMEKCVKNGSTGTSHSMYTTTQSLGFNLGRLLREIDLFDLEIQFIERSGSFLGTFITRHELSQIQLAHIPTPIINRLVQKQDVNNYRLILHVIKDNQKVRDTFVHEFVHYLDSKRAKSNLVFVKGTAHLSGAAYYNTPVELNAHTQEMLANIEQWIKTYYIGIVGTIRKTFVSKFNAAKSDSEIEDAVYVAMKATSHYDMVLKYLNNKQFAMEYLLEKIPYDKTVFMKHLTPENRKRVLSRLYQFYDAVLKQKFHLAKLGLENVVKHLHNENVLAVLKTNHSDIYVSLKKMGLK